MKQLMAGGGVALIASRPLGKEAEVATITATAGGLDQGDHDFERGCEPGAFCVSNEENGSRACTS